MDIPGTYCCMYIFTNVEIFQILRYSNDKACLYMPLWVLLELAIRSLVS